MMYSFFQKASSLSSLTLLGQGPNEVGMPSNLVVRTKPNAEEDKVSIAFWNLEGEVHIWFQMRKTTSSIKTHLGTTHKNFIWKVWPL